MSSYLLDIASLIVLMLRRRPLKHSHLLCKALLNPCISSTAYFRSFSFSCTRCSSSDILDVSDTICCCCICLSILWLAETASNFDWCWACICSNSAFLQINKKCKIAKDWTSFIATFSPSTSFESFAVCCLIVSLSCRKLWNEYPYCNIH